MGPGVCAGTASLSPSGPAAGSELRAQPAARAQPSRAPLRQPPCQWVRAPLWCQGPLHSGCLFSPLPTPLGSGAVSAACAWLGKGRGCLSLSPVQGTTSGRWPSLLQRPVLGDETSHGCLGSSWAAPRTGSQAGRGPSWAAPRVDSQEGRSWRKTEQMQASWVVSGGIWRPGELGSLHPAPNIRKEGL